MRSLALLPLLALPMAAQAIDVTTDGDCPGVVDIDVSGITPGSDYAMFYSNSRGDSTIPAGRCAGTAIDLDPARYAFTVRDYDGDGMMSFSPSLPDAACSGSIQVVDLTTCDVSGAVRVGGVPSAGDLEGAMPSAWHDLITSPHTIDSFAANDISDGGSDMYDGGNHIRPYGDGVELTYSGGTLDTSNAYVDFITEERVSGQIGVFTTKDAIDMHIEGNNGADGGGSVQTWTATSGGWTAHNKTVCDAFDPSINHMWISLTSDGASHTYESNTDNDGDYLTGLPSGTTFFYVLWAETSGRCPTDDDKMAIFDSVLSEL